MGGQNVCIHLKMLEGVIHMRGPKGNIPTANYTQGL